MGKKVNVAIIGCGFMGRAHSNGWSKVAQFFDVEFEPVLKVACDVSDSAEAFAQKWGYEEAAHDWREVIARDDIDIVDIMVPVFDHAEIAIAAMKAGKNVICEKPCALTSAQAKEMAEVAEATGVTTMLNHNYRRVPAVQLAKKLIDEGKLGKIFHYRGAYLQEWIIDPNFPLTWHLQADKAGAGPLYDLGSHNVDLARYLIGEPKSVMARLETIVKERPLPGAGAATFSAGINSAKAEVGTVTVDDAAFVIIDFENGVLGTMDTSRFCNGRKNYNYFEIYGEKGSLTFNLERLNELNFYSTEDPDYARGFRNIDVTEGCHKYASNWWPHGHIIGYEHTFVHAFYEFLTAMANGTKVEPNFEDGYKILRTLDACVLSSNEGRKVDVSEI